MSSTASYPAEISLVSALRQHGKTIGDSLANCADFVITPGEALGARPAVELYFFQRYLSGYEEYGTYLLGDKARALRVLNASGDPARNEVLLRKERQAIVAAASMCLNTNELVLLGKSIEDFYSPLIRRVERTVHILFIGDCLGREIQCFLYPTCLMLGIDLHIVHLGGKTDFLVRKAVQEYTHPKYDLVFYSPFTHESIPEYAGISRKPFMRDRQIVQIAQDATQQAISIVEHLREQFSVPIFVHNSSYILREIPAGEDTHKFGSTLRLRIKQQIRRILTKRIRQSARKLVNEFLQKYLAAQAAHRQLFLLDEYQLAAEVGEEKLRELMYDADDVHPTRLGFALAKQYEAVISANLLKTKKVIVTDLDDTLWRGLVGEGGVEQLLYRQVILKDLRNKGFLLAVSSKNERANVSWQETALREDDFVAMRINWKPKAQNIRSIAEELNIKLKDFVFVDDMPTERAIVKQTFPEITILDSSQETTWHSLACLAAMSATPDEMDRTKLYQEKKRRDIYLNTQEDERQRHIEALMGLELSAKVSAMNKMRIARVTELINRTNQFNINGKRIAEDAMSARLGDPSRQVLCVDVKDRFGDSGMVSATLLNIRENVIEIEAFVLSCRVFGFGIETILMNAIKRIAKGKGIHCIVADFATTPHNQPCHGFLSDHGFRFDDGAWRCDTNQEFQDPDWIQIAT